MIHRFFVSKKKKETKRDDGVSQSLFEKVEKKVDGKLAAVYYTGTNVMDLIRLKYLFIL